MDNEIKPPGNSGPFFDPAAEQPAEPTREISFAEAREKLQASGSTEVDSSAFSFISQYNKTALQDPTKLDQMVRSSASELIDSAQNETGPLSGSQKASLQEFLSKDPMFRRQIETYLRKVLA